MADVVNAGNFFRQSATRKTAVLYLVVANFDDGQTNDLNPLNPQQVEHFQLPEVNVQRVAKGAPYPIDIGFGLTIVGQGTAECDGYLIHEKLFPQFFAAAAYDAIFGDQKPVEGQILVAAGAPVSCVVLEEDTTFGFLNETFPATTGMVLYENPEDEDGYTVISLMRFFQKYLILQ